MPDSQLLLRVAALAELQAAFIEPKLAEFGLNMTSFRLLAAVSAGGQMVSQAELASRLGIAPATLSESVQSHVKRGLLEQVPSPQDRRVKHLRLSSQAQKKMAGVKGILSQLDRQVVSRFSAHEIRSVLHILDLCIEQLESLSEAQES